MSDEKNDAPIPTDPAGTGGGNLNGVTVSETPASGEYGTIAEAIAASTNGVIFIKPGTYNENLVTFPNTYDWFIYATSAEVHATINIAANTNMHITGGTFVGSYNADVAATYMIYANTGCTIICDYVTLSTDDTVSTMQIDTSTLTINNSTISIAGTGIDCVNSTITCNICAFYGNSVYGASGLFLHDSIQAVYINRCSFDGDVQIVDNATAVGTNIRIESSIVGNLATYSNITANNSVFTTFNISSDQARINMYACDLTNAFTGSTALVDSKFVSCNVGLFVSLEGLLRTQFIGCAMANVYLSGSDVRISGCYIFGSSFTLINTGSPSTIITSTVFNCTVAINDSSNVYMHDTYMHLSVHITNGTNIYMTGCCTYNGLLIDHTSIKVDDCSFIGTSSAAMTCINSNTIYASSTRFYAAFQNDASVIYITPATNTNIRIINCHIEAANSGNTGIIITNSTASGSIALYSNVFKSVTNTVLNLYSTPGQLICYHADNLTTSVTGYSSAGGDQNTAITTF